MISKDGSEWIEINLNSVHVITATETMGRFGNGQGAEFAEVGNQILALLAKSQEKMK